MKLFKHVAIAAAITIGAFGAVMYSSSCTKDKCKDVTCLNGGVCSDGNCTCATGYEGTTCATLSRDKFIGTYVGTEICAVGTDAYTVTIATNSDNIKLTYTNLYNQALTATCTMAAADSFTFAGSQATGATTTTFSGSGRLVGSALTVHYTVNDGTLANTCVFTGSK